MTAQTSRKIVTDSPESVTTNGILDREVYSRTGKRVGRVKDIVIDFDRQRIGGLLLTDVNTELFTQDSVPREFVIPYSWVQDADSIVLTVPIAAERVNFN